MCGIETLFIVYNRSVLFLIFLQIIEVTLPEVEEMRLAHYVTIASEAYTSLGLDYLNRYEYIIIGGSTSKYNPYPFFYLPGYLSAVLLSFHEKDCRGKSGDF